MSKTTKYLKEKEKKKSAFIKCALPSAKETSKFAPLWKLQKLFKTDLNFLKEVEKYI